MFITIFIKYMKLFLVGNNKFNIIPVLIINKRANFDSTQSLCLSLTICQLNSSLKFKIYLTIEILQLIHFFVSPGAIRVILNSWKFCDTQNYKTIVDSWTYVILVQEIACCFGHDLRSDTCVETGSNLRLFTFDFPSNSFL